MELQSFAVGIVTMVVFALAIITVIGILKVTRMASQLLTLKRRLEDDERELSRDISMVERTLQNQINHVDEGMHRNMDEMHRQGMAYTDKRIDKLIDTYFDYKKNSKRDLLKD